MNYIPTSPPISMKQYNKSATAKFHMELLFDYYDPEAISQWCDMYTKNKNKRAMMALYRSTG